MLRMRTINQAITEIKQADPNTAITERAIRRLITTNAVPSIKIGRKYLIDMDVLEGYLSNPPPIDNIIPYGVIRPVNVKR